MDWEKLEAERSIAADEETKTRAEEAKRKVYDSRRELEASGYDLSSSAAQAIASVTGSESAQRVADRHKKIAAIKRENTDFTQSLWDVDGVGSALSYAHKTAVASIPSLALAAGGVATGVGLRALGALGSASRTTAAAGGLAAGVVLPNTGEVFENMRDQAGEGNENVAAGLALGAGSTALDLLGVGSIIRKRVARETIDDVATGSMRRRAGVEAAKTAGSEGLTEAGQNLLSEAGREIVDPEGYSFDKEALKRTVESGVAGAIGGAGPGAIHGAVGGRKASDNAVDKAAADLEHKPGAVSDKSSDPMTDYKGDTVERLGPNGEIITEVDATAVKTADGTIRLRSSLEGGTPANLLDTKSTEPSYGPNGEVIDDTSVSEGVKKADFEYQGAKIGPAYEQHLRDLQERDRPDLLAKLPNARSSDPTGGRALVPLGASSLIVGDRADNLRLSVMPLELAKRSAMERGGRTSKEGVPAQTKLEENWAESLSEAIAKGPESVTEFVSTVRAALDKEMPKGPKNRTYFKNPRVQNAQRFGFFEKVGLEYLRRHAQMTGKQEQDLQQAQQQQVQQAAVQQQAQAQADAALQAEIRKNDADLQLLEKALLGDEPKTIHQVLKAFRNLRDELDPTQKEQPISQHIVGIAEELIKERVAKENAKQRAEMEAEEAKKTADENQRNVDAAEQVRKNQANATQDELKIEKQAQDIAETEKQSERDEVAAKEDTKKSKLEEKVAETKAPAESAKSEAPKFEKQISRLEKQIEDARKATSPENITKVVNDALKAEGSDIRIGLDKVKAKLEELTKPDTSTKGMIQQAKDSKAAANQKTFKDIAADFIARKPDLPGENSVRRPLTQAEKDFKYKTVQKPSKATAGYSKLIPPRFRTKEQMANIPKSLQNKFKEIGENSVRIPDDLRSPVHLIPDEIEQGINSWTKGWKNLPEIHVLDVENLPDNEIGQYAKLAMEKLLKAGTRADGEFARINGRPVVLLYSNFISSLDQATGTFFHETLGHFGLRDYWGAQRVELLNEIYRTTKSIRDEVDALHKHYSNKDIPARVEEALVQRFNGGEQIEPSAMGLIRSLVRKFLKMMGWANPPLSFSQGELNNILFAGQENVKSNVESSARGERFGRVSSENTSGVVFKDDGDFDVVLAGENSIREAAQVGIAALPTPLRDQARVTYTNMQSMAKQGLHMASSLRDFVNRNAEKLPALRDYHVHMLARDSIAREMEANLEKAMLPSKEVKTTEKRREMARVGIELSRIGEWPFQPSWRKDRVDVTAKATALWNTLDDKQKTALEAMYKYGHESLIARANAVKEIINSRLEGKIWDSMNPSQKAEVRKDVARQLGIWDTKINQVKGPYIPFSRFGKYATVVRSKEFMALEAKVEKDADKASKEDIDKLDEMRADQDHYRVMFSKSHGVAKELEKQIRQEPDYKGMHIESFQREVIYKQVQAAPWAGLQNMVETIKEELGSSLSSAQQRQIEDALKDVYFKALAENSTRRHLSKRRNVPGMSENMLHAFAETGKSDASFTANVRKNKDITQSINDMRKQRDEGNREGSDDRNDKSLIVNEVIHRHAMGMAARPTPIVDTITNVTSVWFLLSSFRYYVQQAIQTPMVSIPYMSGRFGANDAWSSVFQSTKDLSKSIPNMWDFAINGKFDTGTLQDDGTIKGGTLKDSNGKPLPQDELQMINHLRQAGVLDVGLQYELGSWESFGDEGLKSGFKNSVHKLKTITRAMEIGNRMSAGLAGYRLARKKGMSYEQSRDYAEQMLADTHGDYTAVDRPRAFGMAGAPGKLFFQFRRYSHAIGSMLVKQTHTAFKDSNAEERRIARYTLGYILGQTALVTGTMGIPMVSGIAYLMAAAFGPDDEPTDADRWLRNAIGDDNIANIILKGAPNVLGLDLQSMLGMENVFKVAPFVDIDFTSRDKLASTAFYGLGGAFGGLAGRGADALGHLSEGNYWKGLENLAPGTARTASIAIREANFGVTKKNGDLVISPEEFSWLESFMKGIGINTTHMEDIRRTRNDMFKLDEYFKERTSDLRRDFVEARKEKDGDKQSELRDQWRALQEAKKRYNLPPSPLSNLLSAETQVRSREQRYKELLAKFSTRN